MVPQPWFRKSKKAWYLQVARNQQMFLGKTREQADAAYRTWLIEQHGQLPTCFRRTSSLALFRFGAAPARARGTTPLTTPLATSLTTPLHHFHHYVFASIDFAAYLARRKQVAAGDADQEW